ncbi:protein of unknown function [Candidatus Nitrospira inopinata]|uniref:Uncharacterized protein n=1 Tax=Candidatus Nitrospira inopinata TaxID=1715989 RepID=A0A0S4KVY5_9BACT|nr:hypothetical protein [Candidatus Nitrospira inopinata]CUQ67549.1 protein of unknown function [Candidatus Nitrospira inopinata]
MARLLLVFPSEISRQGEFSGEKTCGSGNRVISRRRHNKAPLLLDQLNLPARFKAEFAAKLPGNQNLILF